MKFVSSLCFGVSALAIASGLAVGVVKAAEGGFEVSVSKEFWPDPVGVAEPARANFGIELGKDSYHIEEQEQPPTSQSYVVTFSGDPGALGQADDEVVVVVLVPKGGRDVVFEWRGPQNPAQQQNGDFRANRDPKNRNVVTIESTKQTQVVGNVRTMGKFGGFGYKRIRLDVSIEPGGGKPVLKGGAETTGVAIRVTLTQTPDAFVPEGGVDAGNTVPFTAKVEPDSVQGKFAFSLTGVSQEPGYCMNAPLSPPASGKHSPSWSDLQFVEKTNPLFTVSGGNSETAETKADTYATVDVTVTSFDYGSFGDISAIFSAARDTKRAGKKLDGQTHAIVEDTADTKNAGIPRDANKNHVADSAAQNIGPDGTFAAKDDLDAPPVGAKGVGDLLSRYEEYRGFLVNGKHTRTSIHKMDVFYVDFNAVGHQKHWTEENLGAPIHKLTRDEINAEKLVTFNHGFAHKTDQAAIKQEANVPVRLRKFLGGQADVAPPIRAKFNYVHADADTFGARSGTILDEALGANEEKVLYLKAPKPDPTWASPGQLKIGGELIQYKTAKKINGRYVMSNLTRGVGNTQKAAHAADAFVPYFYDADMVLDLIVPHECGHNLAIHHDVKKSLMTGKAQAGQYDFSSEFRRDGKPPPSGTMQQFRLK
jgi:hypothetical protein